MTDLGQCVIYFLQIFLQVLYFDINYCESSLYKFNHKNKNSLGDVFVQGPEWTVKHHVSLGNTVKNTGYGLMKHN